MNFERVEANDLTNRQSHGLGFAEAAELFDSGVEYLEIFDVDHSESEDRFIAIGPVARGLIVVVYTEPEEETAASSARVRQSVASSHCFASTWVESND